MSDKTLMVGLVICGILVTALFFRSGEAALLALPFLFYFGLGIWFSPALDKVNIQVERKIKKTIEDDQICVDISLEIINLGPQMVCVTLSDHPQVKIILVSGVLQRRCLLEPGKIDEMKYTFQAKRGHFAWKHIQAVVGDPLGLIESSLNLPAAGEVQIQPKLKRFRPFQFRPNSTLHSPGSIPARLGGSGTNFWGVREYQPGDSLRWLDWRLTARHPGKLFTKEFEQEEIAEIGLILDGRRKTEFKVGQESLFEYGINATASLAQMFIHQGHRVSLLVFKENPLRAYPDYGKIQLRRILDCLSRAQIGSGSGSLDYLENLPVRMFPSKALLVIISPLASDDWQVFPRLRAQGYQVVLISPDPIDFAEKNLRLEKDNKRLALRAARIERQLKLRNIQRLNIPVIDWKTDQPLSPLVRQALSRPMLSRRGW